jgi:integration host factor subunit alpha
LRGRFAGLSEPDEVAQQSSLKIGCDRFMDHVRGVRQGKMMALTKAEMAERLFEQVGLNKREAKEFVDAYFDALREALERGSQVKLSGFGNFELRKKNQRPGRNPKTGEEIPISARTVVTFRPGQKLKERVEAFAGESRA